MPLNPGVVSSSFSGDAFSSNLPGAYINIPNALSQTIQTVSGVRFAVHVLDTVGTNSVQVLTNVQVEYVVIAGGGSGGFGQSNVGGGGGGAGGYRYGTNLAVSAGTYTLLITDAGNSLRISDSTSSIIYIPENSSVAFKVGQKIEILRYGTGEVSVAPLNGNVTLNSKNSNRKISAQYSGAVLTKIGTNEWLLIGDLKA